MVAMTRIRLLKQTRNGMPGWVIETTTEYAEALARDGKAVLVSDDTPLFSDKSLTASRNIAKKIVRPPMGGLDGKGSD